MVITMAYEQRKSVANKKNDSRDKKYKSYKVSDNGDRKRTGSEKNEFHNKRVKSICPAEAKCGGCQYIDTPYEEQLEVKQRNLRKLLGEFGKPDKIIGMENPFHYRNKVHAVVHRTQRGEVYAGVYEEKTHRVVPVTSCFIEDEKADEIIQSIVSLLKSFKMTVYNENSGYGLMRHILIRKGFTSGQIMVVLVTASPIFPSKNNFTKALLKLHPEITTIVQNINEKETSMVLGEKENVMYGKGYIEDTLCGKTFRISPQSFYQVNPVQTQVLYNLAIEMADLKKTDTVIDAYCGIGTIGIVASDTAGEVIGVELNREAIKDAKVNAKINQVKNITFYNNDAGKFMVELAEQGKHVDVVMMDPPRTGSDEAFMSSMLQLAPERIVYISCGPESLARDLKYLLKDKRYAVKGIIPVDMFPMTGHVETVCCLQRVNM